VAEQWGLADYSFAYDDGSVEIIDDLPVVVAGNTSRWDERVTRVPVSTTGEGWATGDEAAVWWTHLPR